MKLKKSEFMALWHYIIEVGECDEGGRLKHDMCEATMYVDVTKELVSDESDEDAKMLAPFVGFRLTIDGYTSYYDGFEPNYGDDEILVMEKTTETRVVTVWKPATVIPALAVAHNQLLDVTIPAMTKAKGVELL